MGYSQFYGCSGLAPAASKGLAEATPVAPVRSDRSGTHDRNWTGERPHQFTCSTTRQALAPPKAKAFTSAAETLADTAEPSTWRSSQSESGCFRFAVGNSEPLRTAWAAQRKPTAPAPATQCPTAPFTELT